MEINKVLSAVNEDLEKFSFGEEPVELYEPARYILSIGGKRLRPLMVILGTYLFDEDWEKAIRPSVAVEVFHNFTLVHDDIMDSSKIRRGNESVHIKWNVNQAILSGDAMQILAYKCLENYESKIQKKLIQIFNDTALKICEGQQLDIEFEKEKDLKFSDYIQMIKYKTAVLLGCSLKMGGIVNNASESDLELLYDIGLNLGLAFQIQDDYLDLFGDEKLIGKKIGGDVIKRKKTVMYHVFKDISSSEDSRFLDQIYDDNKLDDLTKVEKITSLYKDKEVNIKTRKLSQEDSSKAISLIEKLNIKNDNKTGLIDICNKLLARDY